MNSPKTGLKLTETQSADHYPVTDGYYALYDYHVESQPTITNRLNKQTSLFCVPIIHLEEHDKSIKNHIKNGIDIFT